MINENIISSRDILKISWEKRRKLLSVEGINQRDNSGNNLIAQAIHHGLLKEIPVESITLECLFLQKNKSKANAFEIALWWGGEEEEIWGFFDYLLKQNPNVTPNKIGKNRKIFNEVKATLQRSLQAVEIEEKFLKPLLELYAQAKNIINLKSEKEIKI